MGTNRRPAELAITVLAVAGLVVVGLVLVGRENGPPERPAVNTLADAVALGDVDEAAAFLENGADPDQPRVNSFTPLMRAVIRDDVAMMTLLLDGGADLDATTPAGLKVLHVAAVADAPDAVVELISLGVDRTERSRNGMNALDHAADSGSVHALRVLAEAGLPLDAPSEIVTQGHGYPIDEGSPPLSIAARAGRLEAVATLLELGADVDAKSSRGQTALLQAVVTDLPTELVALLLDAGADPTLSATCEDRCSPGITDDALGWARRRGSVEVVALIEEALSLATE